MKHSFARHVLEYVLVFFMGILMALNYQIFILHNAFAPAGINGIATMIQYLFSFSIGYSSLIINIPLALIAFLFVDRHFSLKTLVFVLVFSESLLLMQRGVIDLSRFIYHTADGRSTLLAPVAAGTISGFICGVTIRAGASTGGTDYVAALVHRSYPAYSFTHIIFLINTVVAVSSYFVYGWDIEPVIMCIIYCYLTTRVSDYIIEGNKEALRIEIITSRPEEISNLLIRELRHTATILRAEGGYSHQEKTVLICVINKHQLTHFYRLIAAFPDAFVSVSSVKETRGNFKRIHDSGR